MRDLVKMVRKGLSVSVEAQCGCGSWSDWMLGDRIARRPEIGGVKQRLRCNGCGTEFTLLLKVQEEGEA